MNADPNPILFLKQTAIALRLSVFCLATTALVSQAAIPIRRPPSKPESEPGAAIVVPKPTTGAEATAEPGRPAAFADVLQFDNGDAVHGKLVSIDSQTGLRWKHPESKEAIDFSMANISRIKLDRRKRAPAVAGVNALCSVRLTNNDELLGELVSLDEEKVELDTWYAGKVTVLRKMVRSITPTQGGGANLFEGPTGLEGWRQGMGRNAWRYSNGSFISTRSGSLGRDVKLPNSSNIEFDVGWQGSLQLIVCFYTDSIENYDGNSNAYMLNLNPGYIYLQRMKRNSGSAQLGQAQVPSMNQKNKVHLSIRSNKEQSGVALLIDGALIQQWKDPAGFAGQGGGLLFYSQGNSYTKISNIRVSDWDGKFDQPGAASGKTKEDTVRLANNDKVSGKVQTIREGKLVFVTSYSTFDIPIQRVIQIEMASEQAEQARRNAGDVRACFADRGVVTLQLEQWNDQQMLGSSQNFGKLKLNPEAFNLLQFNLDREKSTTVESAIPDEEGLDGE